MFSVEFWVVWALVWVLEAHERARGFWVVRVSVLGVSWVDSLPFSLSFLWSSLFCEWVCLWWFFLGLPATDWQGMGVMEMEWWS